MLIVVYINWYDQHVDIVIVSVQACRRSLFFFFFALLFVSSAAKLTPSTVKLNEVLTKPAQKLSRNQKWQVKQASYYEPQSSQVTSNKKCYG